MRNQEKYQTLKDSLNFFLKFIPGAPARGEPLLGKTRNETDGGSRPSNSGGRRAPARSPTLKGGPTEPPGPGPARQSAAPTSCLLETPPADASGGGDGGRTPGVARGRRWSPRTPPCKWGRVSPTRSKHGQALGQLKHAGEAIQNTRIDSKGGEREHG